MILTRKLATGILEHIFNPKGGASDTTYSTLSATCTQHDFMHIISYLHNILFKLGSHCRNGEMKTQGR